MTTTYSSDVFVCNEQTSFITIFLFILASDIAPFKINIMIIMWGDGGVS